MAIFTHLDSGLTLAVPPKNGYTLFKYATGPGGGLFRFNNHGYRPYDGPADAMMVRDPLERFASAFRNKVKYHIKGEYAPGWAARLTGSDPGHVDKISVGMMLDAIEGLMVQGRGAEQWEVHFQPQAWQYDAGLMPRFYDIRYDTDLLVHLGINPGERSNRTDHLPLDITRAERERIRELYWMDGELYERYLEFRSERLRHGTLL